MPAMSPHGTPPAPSPDALVLQHTRADGTHLRATLAPALGGALASFCSQRDKHSAPLHWVRETPAQAWESAIPLEFSSFVLLPWSNRIAHGRFSFEGQHVQLPPSPFGLGPHSLHGLGWVQPWHVAQRQAPSALLRWHYDGRAHWPWAFEATQHYRLDEQGLLLELALCNRSAQPMPAGLGHHPYFDRAPQGHGPLLQASTQGLWLSDAEQLPTTLVPDHPTVQALQQGLRVDQQALDHHFVGFGGLARMRWDDSRTLDLCASPTLHTLVLYTPTDKPFFCVEPVSHCANWPQLRAQSAHPAWAVGGQVLGPGESLRAWIRWAPHFAPLP